MILSQTQLEGVRHEIMHYIPRERFEGRLETEWRFDLDAMAVRMKREVWSERLGDESVRWPTTWWDAVKVRWFPTWALRRWPVQWRHADFTIYRGYPDLVMPERQSVMFSIRQYE